MTSIVRYVNINPASGEFIALSTDKFQGLLYILLIIGCLDLIWYDKRMRVKRAARLEAEKKWKVEAKSNVKQMQKSKIAAATKSANDERKERQNTEGERHQMDST